MPSNEDAQRAPVALPDPAKLADAWTQVFVSSIRALRATAERSADKPVPVPFDPQAPARAFAEFATALWSNPAQLWDTQRLIREWAELWTTTPPPRSANRQEPIVAPGKGRSALQRSRLAPAAVRLSASRPIC